MKKLLDIVFAFMALVMCGVIISSYWIEIRPPNALLLSVVLIFGALALIYILLSLPLRGKEVNFTCINQALDCLISVGLIIGLVPISNDVKVLILITSILSVGARLVLGYFARNKDR